MFLYLLAKLERSDLLKPDSEIKNLGAVIGLFVRFINDVEDYGIDWEDHDSKLRAYATKWDITIHGLNHQSYEKPANGTIELPSAEDNDPWGWKKLFAGLRKEKPKGFGGDRTDVTSWTSIERKQHASDNKDPIPRAQLAVIKNGGIMRPA